MRGGKRMNKDYILEKLKENREIFKGYGVKKIGLFGSYASNNAVEDSDIDILIELKKEEMYKNYCKTRYFLEDLFKKDIDLITINQFEQEYKTKIAKDNQEKIKKEIMESVIYA